jgi:type III secretion apparatus needle protein
MAISSLPSGDFNLSSIYDNMLPKMKSSEQKIRAILNSSSAEMNAQELIMMQAKLQEWTLMSQLNSNLVKEIGDTLKSIVQKSA